MRLSDFTFALPEELVAQVPLARRSASRLLELAPGGRELVDRRFPDLVELLDPGDLLVLNDTRVIAARLRGRKDTGGRLELLVERVIDESRCVAHLRASRAPQPGAIVHLGRAARARVTGRRGALFELELLGEHTWPALLRDEGETPLPPYIRRPPARGDRERYQTVFARHEGAVAAPTAGLHVDEALLGALRERGVGIEFVTLHVGAGTFAPVKVEDPSQHRLHAERVRVGGAVCEAVARTRAAGRRVVALGTTCVRALESAALQAGGMPAERAGGGRTEGGALLRPFCGETELFIRPGFRFRVVDALVTNFHLPGSTLLMLVCAFAGYDEVMAAYRHAVAERYRFFSYGDAMFVRRKPLEEA